VKKTLWRGVLGPQVPHLTPGHTLTAGVGVVTASTLQSTVAVHGLEGNVCSRSPRHAELAHRRAVQNAMPARDTDMLMPRLCSVDRASVASSAFMSAPYPLAVDCCVYVGLLCTRGRPLRVQSLRDLSCWKPYGRLLAAVTNHEISVASLMSVLLYEGPCFYMRVHITFSAWYSICCPSCGRFPTELFANPCPGCLVHR